MTKVYVVLVFDRHTDTDVKVFSTESAARGYARDVSVEYDYTEEEAKADGAWLSESEIKEAGWVEYICLSEEGDSVRVQAVEVDAED